MIEHMPNVHPWSHLQAPDGTDVKIDIEMVPVVRALWLLGLRTTASCQDFGEGTELQRQWSESASYGHGDAFISYHRGYAWLKMPVPDALGLANTLLGTDFRDRLTRRWTSGSWRMHIPLVHHEGASIGPAETAQIHFPRDQIGELARTLEEQLR